VTAPDLKLATVKTIPGAQALASKSNCPLMASLSHTAQILNRGQQRSGVGSQLRCRQVNTWRPGGTGSRVIRVGISASSSGAGDNNDNRDGNKGTNSDLDAESVTSSKGKKEKRWYSLVVRDQEVARYSVPEFFPDLWPMGDDLPPLGTQGGSQSQEDKKMDVFFWDPLVIAGLAPLPPVQRPDQNRQEDADLDDASIDKSLVSEDADKDGPSTITSSSAPSSSSMSSPTAGTSVKLQTKPITYALITLTFLLYGLSLSLTLNRSYFDAMEVGPANMELDPPTSWRKLNEQAQELKR